MTAKTTAQQARDAQERISDAWIAVNEGDTLTGEIIDVTTNWSDQRMADYPLLVVRTDDGEEKKVHCFSTVLYNEALRQRPMPGERITITYLGLGEVKVRGRSAPKRYSFRIDGRSAAAIDSMYDRVASQQTRAGGGNSAQRSAAPPADSTGEPTPDDEIPF